MRQIERPGFTGLGFLALGILVLILPQPAEAARRRGQQDPNIVFESPSWGSFHTSPTVMITGRLYNAFASQTQSLTVNGVSVLPLGAGGLFTYEYTVDPTQVFQNVTAHFVHTNGFKTDTEVLVFHTGDSVADGAYSPMGVALRLNDSGLDEAEPVVVSGVTLDLAALLPVGTSLGTISGFDVSVDTPAPSTSGFSLDMNAQSNGVDGFVDINDVDMHFFLDGFWFFDCWLHVWTDVLEVNGLYDLQPDAGDPSKIDVNQVGNLSFGNTVLQDDLSGVTCDIGEFLGLVDIGGSLEGALDGFLSDPDGAGPADGPIADEIEVALEGIEISGPLGQAIGVNLETPLYDVFEDVDGITLDNDARITAVMPDPNAVDLAASYHISGSFPSFGANAPGGSPYDLGLSLSASAFNQLLRAEVESGLLLANLTELAGLPLNGTTLALLMPEYGSIPGNTPFELRMRPRLSPALTGNPGSGGAMAELEIGALEAVLYHTGTEPLGDREFLKILVDTKVGLDIDFVAGELVFSLTEPPASAINFVTLKNKLLAQNLDNLLPLLISQAFPDLAGSLGSFPLPDFLGLSLDLVETTKDGDYLSLYLDLTPVVP